MSYKPKKLTESYKSMLGALVGDAAGAVLEFCHDTITDKMAQRAITMPGGGSIRTGPGQITDDGELALCLWRALNASNAHNTLEYPYEECFKEYAEWYDSMPFDIGRTCSLAFSAASYRLKKTKGIFNDNIKKLILHTIHSDNETSEANGALMRITALPTWAIQHGISVKNTVQMAKDDALVSHPNIVCQEVNAVYVFAIMNLLLGVKPDITLTLTTEFVNKYVSSDKVRTWFFEESLDYQRMECIKNMGHVRYAFGLAIYFLRNPQISYEKAIHMTLLKGGDTDTNAAIVGGLVACYQPIPEYMLNPVLSFDSTKCNRERKGHFRSEKYCVKYVLDIE